jgi:hypothetical protein
MVRRSLIWLAILLVSTCTAAAVSAQNAPKEKDLQVMRWREDNPGGTGLPTLKENLPIMEFVLATCGCALVLFILCAPSRKR